MTRHHPDSLSLMEYSAGNLSEPHALCIKLHLDKCSHCRSRVDTLDSLGAVMMEQQPKVTVSESMFDNILSKIDSEPVPRAERAGCSPKTRCRRESSGTHPSWRGNNHRSAGRIC